MKAGWEIKKLGEVLEKTETIDPLRTPDRTFSYIDVSSVDNELLRVTETQTLLGKDAPSRARRLVRKDDVLFATIRPTLRRIALVPAELDGQVCSTGYFVLRPKAQLDSRYCFYFLQTETYLSAMETLQKGASYPAVTDSDVRSQPIPIPPLHEQAHIVGILDEAFASIATAKANTKKNLENAKAVFESHLNSVFSKRGEGWVEKKLEEVCESIMDCVNKTAPKVDYPTPFKMIRTTNVRNGKVDLTSVNYVTEEVYQTWTRRQTPQKGDIILTREAPLGEVGIIDSDDQVFLGQRLVSYRVNPLCLASRFLLYGMQSEAVQQQIQKLASGSTVQHMRVPDSKKLKIPLPALRIQKSTIEILDLLSEETSRLTSLYTQKLSALEDLKKSLLHQAFTGKL